MTKVNFWDAREANLLGKRVRSLEEDGQWGNWMDDLHLRGASAEFMQRTFQTKPDPKPRMLAWIDTEGHPRFFRASDDRIPQWTRAPWLDSPEVKE